jgi:TPR repeat protein
LPAAAADDWIEVKSAHFTVVSNAGDRATRRLVWQLEQVRSAISALFAWAKPDLSKPLSVIVLKDQNSMRALAPRYWEERRNIKPASVWVTGADQHYLVLRTDVEAETRGEVNPYISSYFSYIGLVLGQSLDRDLPFWFIRGFTGVLSNTIVNDDHVLLGAPIPWKLEILRERAIYTLPRLLSFTRASPETNDSTPRETYDAETWAFVHFLMFADAGKRSGALNDFSKLVAAGKDVSSAFAETLGPVEALENSFRLYLQRPLYTFRRFNIDVSVDRERFPVRPLAAAESAAIRAQFHVAMNRPVEAQAAIAEARKADANAPGSYLAEGLLADRQDKPSEAKAAYTKATELKTTSAFAYYRLASLTFEPNASKETFEAIEKQLLAAVTLNVRYAAAYAWLGEVRAFLGDKESISLVRRAIQLEPTEPSHRLRAAIVLMRVGRPAEARADAQAALTLADTDFERREAERVLAAVANAEAAMAKSRPAAASATAPAATPAAAPAAAPDAAPASSSPVASRPASTGTPASPPPPAASTTASETSRPAPFKLEELESLTNACHAGEGAACSRLLPTVEWECKRKVGPACRFAGFLYERGRGVPANAALAASFYNQACEVGERMGCVGFALLQASGTGVIQNDAKAQMTLSQLCDDNVIEACTQLAVMILQRPTSAETTRARELLTKACNAKDERSCDILKSLRK